MKHHGPLRRARAILALPLLLAAAGSAWLPEIAQAQAQAQTSPYRLGVSQSLMHDSNLLRAGEGQLLPEGLRRSDTVSSTALILGLDQPISRQRLGVDATLRANRFAHNKRYDNEGYNLRAVLDWATVERLGGSLQASRNRTLARFAGAEDGLSTERNTEQTTRLAASAYYGLAGPYRLEAGLERSTVGYSSERYRRREFEQDSASFGLRWRPSDGLNLRLALRHTAGSYPHYLIASDGSSHGDDFRRQALELSGEWIPSAASRVRARLSQGRTRYDIARERDESGLTGEVGWTWQPAGRFSLVTTLRRQPAQDAYLLDTSGELGSIEYSRMSSVLALRAGYQLSAKLALQAEWEHTQRRLERTLYLGGLGADSRAARDHDNTLRLSASWQAQRSLNLGCDWQRFSRSASDLFLAQRSSAFSCWGQFMLQ